ncbi:MAG: ParB N-terminal domain-containing protein [Planctomycetes bacterium]|nr:ParB N-terminal domain-containing protein [Planctomycetota bacterium]
MVNSTREPAAGQADADPRYAVFQVPVETIKASPENDDLYGEIEHDEQMEALMASISHRGLEEPLLLTADDYILSGHRRFYAVRHLGWKNVPVRWRADVSRQGNQQFHQALAEYNPQRIKRVGSLLKEALLRDDSPEDTYAAIERNRRASLQVDAEFMAVDGAKQVPPISDKKRAFLEAVQQVIEDLRHYWPLGIRQIHYNLLNNPPLTSTPKRSKFGAEKYRYRNNKPSYDALVRLLTSARYHGAVSMACIDDPTRPQKTWGGWNSVSRFVHDEVSGFLCGYHRDRQQGQERHIELFAEKNTLLGILQEVCQEYYVPLNIGRGFCSIPVWRDIANRFRRSGRKRMTLIIVSDYDPEGLELADDAIRSLEQLWRIPIDGHRIAVTREQIDELQLAGDFNPAKESSSRFASFVDRTGGEETWEVEALPPDYLVGQVRAAIEANLDMELYEEVVEQEREDCDELHRVKQEIAGELDLL